MRYVMFSKAGCPFCSLMKAALKREGIPFEIIDLTEDAKRVEFYALSGKSTVPQLYWTDFSHDSTELSGESLGGWSEVKPILNTLGNRFI